MLIDNFLKFSAKNMYKNKTIQRGDAYEEGPRLETKNPWRWEWVDNTVNDNRVGLWIRKIDVKGKA